MRSSPPQRQRSRKDNGRIRTGSSGGIRLASPAVLKAPSTAGNASDSIVSAGESRSRPTGLDGSVGAARGVGRKGATRRPRRPPASDTTDVVAELDEEVMTVEFIINGRIIDKRSGRFPESNEHECIVEPPVSEQAGESECPANPGLQRTQSPFGLPRTFAAQAHIVSRTLLTVAFSAATTLQSA